MTSGRPLRAANMMDVSPCGWAERLGVGAGLEQAI
jgi:hypothetical protein